MPRRKVVYREKRKRGRPPKKKRIDQAKKEVVPELQTELITENTIKRDAPETSYFVLCNGKPVKNIKELADVMEELEDQVFNYHVAPDKNDFATWIKDIFKDIELAEKLAGVKDKKHMQLVLYKHITHKLW
jgi:hypothetical protein